MALSKRKISKIWSPLRKVLLKEHNHSLFQLKRKPWNVLVNKIKGNKLPKMFT